MQRRPHGSTQRARRLRAGMRARSGNGAATGEFSRRRGCSSLPVRHRGETVPLAMGGAHREREGHDAGRASGPWQKPSNRKHGGGGNHRWGLAGGRDAVREGKVIILSAEDVPEDTNRPHFGRGSRSEAGRNPRRRPRAELGWDLGREALQPHGGHRAAELAGREIGDVALIVIDPSRRTWGTSIPIETPRCGLCSPRSRRWPPKSTPQLSAFRT